MNCLLWEGILVLFLDLGIIYNIVCFCFTILVVLSVMS